MFKNNYCLIQKLLVVCLLLGLLLQHLCNSSPLNNLIKNRIIPSHINSINQQKRLQKRSIQNPENAEGPILDPDDGVFTRYGG
uniref:Uncharacterized protein n=1 Tax=Meloidogyne floridensis TaxID=298350 RepID=A0A915PAH3_9BILA